MNSDELRQRQLARLRGELIEPIGESALEFAPDPLDAAEHQEQMERISVQPENPREQLPFIVGNRRDEYGDLEALPWPRWPSPGQPMTPEISRAHSNELLLVMDANQSLQKCVRLMASRIREPDCWYDGSYMPPSQLFESAWNFLTGLWRSRGITPPTDETLQRWAREYNEEHYTRKRKRAEA